MAGNTAEVKSPVQKTQSNPLEKKVLDRDVNFELNAPQADKVSVAGSFNNWKTDSFFLKKGKDGLWKGQFRLKTGRYEYRFLVDGRWENKSGVEYASNSFGSTNCVLEVK